ncbi:hypothetical protein THRCLA_11906 [Thraustotheca clavata]|uniref:Uncharacterized protein n=1 Tax=Thraustotheca clavata TaxID=74557 RepID=A0A1V9Y5F7_9STRA|nr:hypothetical protein THRCLA_11906 [Thraustotheca clavata]
MGEWLPSQDYVFDPATRIAQCTCRPIHSQGWNYPWIHASTPATLTAYLFLRFMRDQHALLRVVGTKQSPSFVLSQDTFAIERGFYEQYPSPPHRSPTSNTIDASIMMLYNFVSQLPLRVVQKEASRINRHVQQALLRPLLTKLRVHPTMLDRYLATSNLIVPNVFQDTEDLKPPSPTNDLETISINVLLELFQPQLLKKMQAHYVHQTDAILQKSSLISLYEAWKELLQTHINQYLTQTTRFTNHNQFIQELCKIIPLQTPPNPFEAFVAQLRECYIAKEQPQRVDPKVFVSTPQQPPFNGRWLYEIPAEQPVLSNAISMVTMLRWVTMAYSFRQYLDQNTLCVRSDLAMHPTIWSTFYLDNEYRVARVFPNGETTMREWSSQWLHGDYIGAIEDGAIALTFYSWPMESSNLAYLIRLRIIPLSTTKLLYQWRLSTCAVAEGGDYCTMSATMRQQSLRGKEKILMSIDMNYLRLPVA